MKKGIFMDEALELLPPRPPAGHLIYSPDSYNCTQSWNWKGRHFSLAQQREDLNDECEDKMNLPNGTMETGYTYCYVSLREYQNNQNKNIIMNGNRNKYLLMALLIPLLLFYSCRDDNSGLSNEAKTTTVRFSMSVAGLKSTGRSTRSIDPATVSESTVNDLWILQFQNGTLKTKTYISSVKISSVDAILTAGLSNIYFVANAGATAFSSFATGTTTETNFQSTTKSLSAETDILTNSTYIPMEGVLTGVTLPSTGSLTPYTVALTRLLARIDITYTTTALPNFEIRKIRVCNVPNTMQYYPPASATTAFPASPSVTTVNSYDYTDVSGMGGTYTFYLPENQRGIGTNTTETDATKKIGVGYATYIELVGYTKGATSAGQEVVYRVYPGADIYNDYNLCRNTYYTLNANIAGVSPSDARVTRTPRANCYIVAPGGSVYIPLARANDSDLGTQISDLTASGYTFGVLWQDGSSDTGNVVCSQSATDQTFGVFKVTAASTYTGNAVVYLKSGSTILWSWHIWVTNYDPGAMNVSYNGQTWMDRNLGATSNSPTSTDSYGLYYQWGRKDPFPNSGSVTLGTNSSTTNLMNSIQNPTLWYYCSTTNDWYTDNSDYTNNTLWKSTKTIYDPCPPGWKVPANGSWSTLTSSNFYQVGSSDLGFSYTDSPSFFYPYAGYRSHNAGTILAVDAGGYCWSSTYYSSSTAYFLSFSSGPSVNPSRNDNRAIGFGVRCVQDN